MQPDIVVFAMVYGYQRRYWWQLSSICEQTSWQGNPVPKMLCWADVTERDPHQSWNDRLFNVFGSSPANLRLQTWKAADDSYARRGHIRSANIKAVLAMSSPPKFIAFVDADMAYSPEFWSSVYAQAQAHIGDHRVLATPRMSMAFDTGYALVGAEAYDARITSVEAKILARCGAKGVWPAAGGRISGAGFFQMVSVPALQALVAKDPGFSDYVPRQWNKDNDSFRDAHITRSDRKFRVRLGGIIPLKPPPSYHINHYRRNDPGFPRGEVH